MSGPTRTAPTHLRLVDDVGGPAGETRGLVLSRTPRLERFARASAEAGLQLEEAIHLALHHALALKDAVAFGLDADTARRLLNDAAVGCRASRPLGDGDAAYLRRLARGVPLAPPALPATLSVKLDERTCTRVCGALSEAAVRAAVVEEMISWELAATLEGRTMGEWALHALAEIRRAA